MATITRELKIAARHKTDWVIPPLFFAIVVTLFALGNKPGDPRLAAVTPSVLWVGALLAALLTLDRMFRADLEDGWLEQVYISPGSPSMMVLGKFTAHWMMTGMPLLILAAPLGLQLGFPTGEPLTALLIGLALGTPLLSIIGGFAAALTVALPRAGLLLPILVLPIMVPVVIFGSGTARAALSGLSVEGPVYFLSALLVLALTLLPWASSAALKNSID